MPHLHTAQLAIPFSGRSPQTRHASLSGAQVAAVRAGSQKARMLLAYLEHGPLTDLSMAALLGLPESRISARRSGLQPRDAPALVQYVDLVDGRTGPRTADGD